MKTLAWIGTGTSVMGAFVVAMGAMLAGYSLFLVGSISWLIVAARRLDAPLGLLNACFLLANMIGFARAL